MGKNKQSREAETHVLLGLKEKAHDGSKEASPALVGYDTLFLIGATLAFWVAQVLLRMGLFAPCRAYSVPAQ